MSHQRVYYTFPIALFQTGFDNISKAVNNAMLYAGYAITTKLQYGTNEEKMKAAGNQLNMTFGDLKDAYKTGQGLYNDYAGTPMTSIAQDIIFDYYLNQKTEFQIAALLGFAAIRSILQKKAYCKTNKRHIHARMLGYTSANNMPYILSELQLKYAKRWHMDKIIRHLEHNWGLKTFSNHSRGLYIGFDKVDYETLAKVNEERKIKTKDAQLRAVKTQALAAARQKIAANM